jgi:hypothetical protein
MPVVLLTRAAAGAVTGIGAPMAHALVRRRCPADVVIASAQ